MNSKIFTAAAVLLLLISGIVAFASVADADNATKEITAIEYEKYEGTSGTYYTMYLQMSDAIDSTAQGKVIYYAVDGAIQQYYEEMLPAFDGTNKVTIPLDDEAQMKDVQKNAILLMITINGQKYKFQTLSVDVGTPVNGTVTSDKAVAKVGETVTLKVIPETGYVLKTITLNGAEIAKTEAGYTFEMPAAGAKVAATFELIPTYSIVIEQSQNGKVTSGVTVAPAKETVTLTVTPADGYRLNTLSVKAGTEDVKVSDDYKFVMPASDVIVTATFTDAEPCKVTFDSGILVTANGKDIESGATVPVGTVVTVDATEKLGYTYTVTPALTDGKYTVTKDVEFKVTYTEKEYSDASFSGDINTSSDFSENQLVTVPSDSTLHSKSKITINGKLYVPAGVTLTVSTGAQLIINGVADIQGNLEVEGADEYSESTDKPGMFIVSGEATISGTVDVDGLFATGTVDEEGAFVPGNGKIAIKAAAEIAGEISGNIEIAQDAALTVTGSVSEETVFTVYGNLTVNSDVPVSGFKVKMKENGVFDVVKVVLGTTKSAGMQTAAGKITVTDDGIYYKDAKDEIVVPASEKNKVEIDGSLTVKAGDSVDFKEYNDFGYGAAVTGITISSTCTETKITSGDQKDQIKHASVMNLSGNISVADEIIYDQSLNSPVKDTISADITAIGVEASGIKVVGDLLIAENVTVTLKNVEIAAAVTVSTGAGLVLGETVDVKAAVSANAKGTNVQASLNVDGATITVSGEGSIVSLVKLEGDKKAKAVNATVYGSYTYVSFDKAVAALVAGTTKEINVLGEQSLTANAEVPAGTAVKLTEGSHLSIGSEDSTDVVLTIASGNGIILRSNNSNGIEVYGTLYAVKASNIDSSLRTGTVEGHAAIASDVASYALKADGKTQDVSGSAKWTNIYTALDEAESGQTVTIQRDIDVLKSVTIKDGVTLDANGKTVTVVQKATLTVTGTLDLTDDGSNVILEKPEMDNNRKVKTSGAAISYTGYILYAGDAVPVSQQGLVLPGAYYTQADKDVNVLTTYANGAADAMKAKDYTVVLKADKDGKVALGEISFIGEKDKSVKISVEKAEITGTISLSHADFYAVVDSTIDARFVSGSDSVAVKAKVDALCMKNGVFGEDVVLAISGSLKDIDDKTETSVVFEGSVFITDGFISVTDKNTVNGDLVVCVAEDASTGFAPKFLDVAGTVTVRGGSALNVEKLTVSGAVKVENGKLFAVEATVTGSIDASAVDEEGASVASAEIETLYIGVDSKILKPTTGVTASVVGSVTVTGYALAAPDATVPEVFKDAAKYRSTVFVAEGKDYVVAYAPVGGTDLTIGKIDYDPDNADFDEWVDSKGESAGDKTIGKIDKVTAKIDYNIYTVKIVVGDGIENVAIDGNLVTGGVMEGFKAGTHTVTYSVGFGYTGTATLTVNGEKQSGMTFTASGTSESDRTVKLQLSGIVASSYEPTPVPVPTPAEDDGLSITDYLLIVLVVLIVIMAVIVAMRLMRS